MDLQTFLSLPTEEVAAIVRSRGSKVCVFPFNGTRRWFLLEHGRDNHENLAQAYIKFTAKAYIETYKLVLDYGLDTIVAPVFGSEIFNRGESYMSELGSAMSLLATHPAFLDFYREYNVRIHFYGDYRKQLGESPYAYICDSFDDVTKLTALHTQHRLFYGVCADDATETVAELSIKHFQKKGKTPSRRELIETYYGEYIEKADIFLGFEKFNVFDYPMLNWGEESLYFMVAPSLYLTERQLRNILYDYIYLRPVQDPVYEKMAAADFETMRIYYQDNREVTFGVGEMRGGIWYAKR
jgi:adenosine tuberculosinyltransferase